MKILCTHIHFFFISFISITLDHFSVVVKWIYLQVVHLYGYSFKKGFLSWNTVLYLAATLNRRLVENRSSRFPEIKFYERYVYVVSSFTKVVFTVLYSKCIYITERLILALTCVKFIRVGHLQIFCYSDRLFWLVRYRNRYGLNEC